MAVRKRRQWVRVWNSVFKRTGNEGRAFASANSAIKELMMEPLTVEQLREAAKALPGQDPIRTLYLQTADALEERATATTAASIEEKDCAVEAPAVMAFIGGALSFAEADDYHDGQEIDRSIWEEKNVFDLLHRNIWNSDLEIPEKARLTMQAATDLSTRIGEVKTGERSIFEKVREFILPGWGEDKTPEGVPAGDIVIFKDAAGGWRWFATHSNKFFDREKEVFPAAVHQEYEHWVDATGNFPELRLWHVPGTRIGLADFVAYDEPSGLMISSGVFDKGMEDVAERLAGSSDLACSHGFAYRQEDLNEEGVYARYRSFEVTVLPAAHAANPWTAINVGQIAKEVKVGMEDAKRAFLVEHMGEERTGRIEAQLAELGKELDEAGISFKGVLEENGTGEGEGEGDGGSGEAGAATEEKPSEGETAGDGEKPVAADGASGSQPAGEEDSDGGGKSTELVGEISAVINTVVREQLAPLQAVITELQESVKGLKESDDSKVANAMRPRVEVSIGSGKRPTEAESNLDSDKGDTATGGGKEGDKEEQVVNPYVKMALNGGRLQQG
jgi:hypothetical protein